MMNAKKLNTKNIEDIYGLMPIQEGMLFHYLKNPGSDHYFEQLSLDLLGKIDRFFFEKSWNFVIEVNEVLRTLFRWEKTKNPAQVILKKHPVNCFYYDFSGIDSSEQEKSLEEIKVKDRQRKMDLRDVPFRVTLCKTGKFSHMMIISYHHILYDGWSNGILLKEFLEAYNDFSYGNTPVKQNKTRFKEFLLWHRNRDVSKEEKFWHDYLKDFEPNEISIKRIQNRKSSPGSGITCVSFTGNLKNRMEELVTKHRLTLSVLLYCAWGILLQRYNNSDDVVFGTTISGRSLKLEGIEDMVGLFINTVPLRVQTRAGETIIDLLYRTHHTLQSRETFAHTALVKIKEYSNLAVDVELFDSIVVVENYPLDAVWNPRTNKERKDGKLTIQSFSMREMTHYDLTLGITLHKEIRCDFVYREEVIDKNAVQKLANHFLRIVEEMVENHSKAVMDINVLSREEKKQLLFDFNDIAAGYPVQKTIPQLFAVQVEKTPAQIAVVGNWQSAAGKEEWLHLTFHQLNRSSGHLAFHLRDQGVRPDTIVGIMEKGSADMAVGLLGILKAGAAYLPIDPEYPPGRRNLLLIDAEVKYLVVKHKVFKVSVGGGTVEERVSLLPVSSSGIQDYSYVPPAPISRLAYVIYTSGTTAVPKGVLVDHRGLVNFVSWRMAAYKFGPADVTLQLFSPFFDGFSANFFPPLLSGGKVIFADMEKVTDYDYTRAVIFREKVTNFTVVPSFYRVMLQGARNYGDDLGTLRFVVLAGEAANPELVRFSQTSNPNILLANEYGPSENTVAATVYMGMTAESVLIIGKPITNNRVMILDGYQRLVPVWVAGELCLSGESLARGYLNRPEFTWEKFINLTQPTNQIQHHQNTHLSPKLPNLIKIYKTGDLARWLPDGNIEFLGRRDLQVKIRGFRIELGEIESRLLSHKLIGDVVVIARADHRGDTYLCAYVVTKNANEGKDTALIRAGLREYLSRQLPGYMIPSHFVCLEAIPLTASGKPDRRALPEPGPEVLAVPHAALENEWQEKLAAIWGEVLAIDRTNIGVEDDFFHLGGHSLNAVSLAAQILKTWDVRISLDTIFQYPTIRGMARFIERIYSAASVEEAGVLPAEKREYYRLSRNQYAFYMLHQYIKQGTFFNVPLILPLFGPVKLEKVAGIFKCLIQRHESLRTSFHIINNEPVQVVHGDMEPEMKHYDLISGDFEYPRYRGKGIQTPEESSLCGSQGTQCMEELITNFVQPFELSRAPLLRVGLVSLKKKRHLLMMDMHHLVTDGASWNILVNEFLALYQGKSAGELIPVTVQYRDFVQWERQMLKLGKMKEHEDFWLRTLSGNLPVLDMPTDFPRPHQKSYEGDSFGFKLEIETSQRLRQLARETGVTLYMLFLAAAAILLHRITNQTDIIISSPAAGRPFSQLENTVGLVMNSIMMRNYPCGEKTATAFLQEVKQTVTESIIHQVYPFEELLTALNYKKNPGHSPIADVELTMLNMFASGSLEAFDRASDEPVPAPHEAYFHKTSRLDITISILDRGDSRDIPCVLEYCTALYRRERMERFAGRFQQVLRRIVKNPRVRLWEIDLITPEEKRLILYHFNEFDEREMPFFGKKLYQLFEEQVQRSPDYAALYGRSQRYGRDFSVTLTYRELNEKSRQMALRLRERGVKANTLVGIMLERSVEMIVGILGILKAGGAYLPIDSDFPEQRIQYMLNDSRAGFLVTSPDLVETFKNLSRLIVNVQIVLLDEILFGGRKTDHPVQGDCTHLSLSLSSVPAASSAHLAYIIYTSGSMGRPKGVMVEQRSLLAYLAAFEREFEIASGDRVLQQASYSFDTYGEEVYPTLLKGGMIVIPQGEVVRDIELLMDFIGKHRITIIDCSPLLLNELNRQTLPGSVRLCISGGDLLKGSYIGNLLEGNRLVYNTYGPTETTICATYFRCKLPVEEDIPIGKPITHYTVYILDRRNRLLPVGIPGEISIIGHGTARGYLNNPELTNKKFLRGVQGGGFYKKSPPGCRRQIIYRTGDLGCWLEDGNIRFLGRIDQQVKIRGYRIELMEIEKNILAHEGVGQAVVMVRERGSGEKYICAYLTQSGEGTLRGYPEIVKRIRIHLSRMLPDYMIPAYFVLVERIPLTSTGKIDSRALPEPVYPGGESEDYKAPRNHVEETVAKVWSEVFAGIDSRSPAIPGQVDYTDTTLYSRVGIDDNFFEVGGDSIKAIQISARLKAYGLDMKVSDLFLLQTIRSLVESGTVAWIEREIPQALVDGMGELTPPEPDYHGLSFDEIVEVQKWINEIKPGSHIENVYPLSPMQSGILFHYLKEPTSGVYFDQVVVSITGEIHQDLLKKSFMQVTERYEIFRTIFCYEVTDRPLQVVFRPGLEGQVDFRFEDISALHLVDAEGENYFNEVLKKDRKNTFNLLEEIPMRISLFRTGVHEYRMVWSYHHILIDGWCIGIVLQELMQVYGSLVISRPIHLPAVYPYLNYIKWVEQQDKERGFNYWREYLRDYRQPVTLAGVSRSESDDYTYEVKEHVFCIEEGLREALNEIARKNRVTVNVLFQTAWGILLHRYNNTEDVVYGGVVSGRPPEVEGIEHMVGLFINTVPVRVQIKTEQTFRELLESMHWKTLESRSYEYLALPDIQALTPLSRRLINHILIFENYPIQDKLKELSGKACGFAVDQVEFLEHSNYDFNVFVMPEESLQVKFNFNSCLYKMEQVRRIEAHFNVLLRQITANPQVKLCSLEIVAREEKQLLLETFNNPDGETRCAGDRTLPQLFARQVEKTPDNIALVGVSGKSQAHNLNNSKFQQNGYSQIEPMFISYQELDKQTNRLARLLKEKGVSANTMVGIIIERSVELIIGILGILKAGAAYLPIDPDNPLERIDYMLTDIGVSLLIAGSSLANKINKLRNPVVKEDFQIIFLDAFDFFAFSSSHLLNFSTSRSANLAYIIYTSGTTGQPKGIPITHANLSPLLHWEYQNLGIGPKDRVIQNASCCFDFSVMEIFLTLTSGATLYMITREILLNPDAQVDFILKQCITALHITPTHLQYLLKAGKKPDTLRFLFIGGEKLPLGLMRKSFIRVKKSCRAFNIYGPTEVTIVSTILEIDPAMLNEERRLSSVPIGRPVANLSLLVLDIFMHICPLGIVGELFIAGDGVASGYLNQPELTAEKYCLRRPGGRFLKKLPPWTPRKNFLFNRMPCLAVYKTGDLTRWLPDGNMEFISRVDHQVKIRGFRIETGEIEKRLVMHNSVKEVVVMARKREGDEGEENYLCAYIVPVSSRDVNAPDTSAQSLFSTLRDYLTGQLPHYMIPAYFVLMEKMSINPNGKVDLKALPEPETGLGEGEDSESPRDEIEAKLTGIWCDVLDRTAIGRSDDFFESGGHSLKASLLKAKIHKTFDIDVPLAQIFSTPTIKGLGNYLQTCAGNVSHQDINAVEKKEYYKLSSAQQRLYFLDQFETIHTSYNMPDVLHISGPVKKERFTAILDRLISRHQVLRTSFASVDNQPVQRIHDDVEFELEYFFTENKTQRPGSKSYQISDLCAATMIKNFVRSFDLTQTPLLRVGLVNISPDEHLLLFDMHHIIADGTAMGILVAEFSSLYNNESLAPLRIQYKDFSQWQIQLIAAGKIKKQENYWLKLFGDTGDIPCLQLSTDYPRPEVFSFAGDVIRFKLDTQRSAALKKWCTSHGTTLYMELLAMFNILLGIYSGQEDIIVGSGIVGRNHENLRKLLGLFVNMLAMRNYPGKEKTVQEFFREVRETALLAFENQDVQFEDLIRQLNLPRNPAHNPLFDVCFVVQNFEQSEFRADDVIFNVCPFEYNTAKFDITLFTWEKGDEIHFTLEYYTAIFKQETILRMKTHFLNIIEQVISQPETTMNRTVGKLDILSETEKRQLLFDFNDTGTDFPADKNICQLFMQQVQQTPHHIALVGNGQSPEQLSYLGEKKTGRYAHAHGYDSIAITYHQLDCTSNRLARYLYHEKGLKPEEPVAIWITPSLYRVISILAVLKAGGAYVPIDPALPEERIKYILNDASAGVVISEKRFIRLLNRLQWECRDFHSYLCLDSDNIYKEDETEKNELMAAELWHHVGTIATDEITGGGWLSSYTGKPFSQNEMDEYGENILQKLEPLLHPRLRVLEIGCASGISMFRLAPRVGLYYGTDLSSIIIEKNRERVNREGHHNIRLSALPAHDIDKIDEKNFDLVIINSVIQCFHGHHYLRKVLKKSMGLLGENGYLFIGDIMDQDRKKEMVQELTAFKNAHRDSDLITKTDFSSELFVSKEFWQDLQMEWQEIEKVECSGKIHTIENELTKFRYDTLITIKKVEKTPGKNRIKQKHQDDSGKLRDLSPESLHMQMQVSPNSLAYIIYTSGTTGIPKGVTVQHGSLVNLCAWHQRNYEITASDHATLYAGFGFDASVWELFPYLLKGSCLHIIDPWLQLDMPMLNTYFEQRDITISFLPTQVCQQFMDLDNSSLRILLTGGDKLRRTGKGRRGQTGENGKNSYTLYNNYGPTEYTVVTTAYPVKTETDNIPIGSPIANTRIYILEGNSFRLQPLGTAGELCIAGTGLARGYLNQPELTAAKFTCICYGGNPNYNFYISEKIYLTGDLARQLPDGTIEFLGRVDQQVKIRGFRIEPGEIENRLIRHEAIKAAVVIARESETPDKYLCAYIVKASGAQSITAAELKEYLAGKLPDYMIPQYFVELEQIPLTTNGKLSRKALPEPVINREDYVPPATETEIKLAEIWREVLGISQPGVTDNFFDIGGDSIKAIQVTARLKKYALDLKVSDLFLHPTIGESAQYVIVQAETEEKECFTTGDPGFSAIDAEELDALEIEFSDID